MGDSRESGKKKRITALLLIEKPHYHKQNPLGTLHGTSL